MAISQKPLLTEAYLRSVWAADYEAFKDSAAERDLESRLDNWARRRDLGETASEAPFISTFFSGLWGYTGTGETASAVFTYRQQFPIAGAGQGGGTGLADLALGHFTANDATDVPQVVCEFKGVRGSLDTPQRRPGRAGARSPVEQARDYLWGARRGLYGNEEIVPEWAIVTNMREFRLYWFDRMPHEALVFTLGDDLFDREHSLFQEGDAGRFRRFVFSRVFHKDELLSTRGGSALRRLIERQWVRQRAIEKGFYEEYRALREAVYNALVTHNPDFAGTKGQLLRVAQRILDRLLFILYCEDRGGIIGFPPQLLRDLLRAASQDRFYDPSADEIWRRVVRLFRTMDAGGNFGPDQRLQRFNGGLFAPDPIIENLYVPNYIFCVAGQGRNEASVDVEKKTVFYFSARYDFSSTGHGEGLDLYTLGHIFEQSITELEIREAELDERPSIGKITKRKRDGVYYTPERIVRAIVVETITPRLDELKLESGWSDGLPPDLASLDRYEAALWRLRLVDPACGSGAFLVTALRFFADEHARVESLRMLLGAAPRMDHALGVMDRLLGECLYGVDINPSSVEITKLALWLHSARSGRALSSLDLTIRDGNSLVGDDFFTIDHLQVYAAEERERVNAFNWETRFPEIHAAGGFDFVVGNPPYVKLQNFRQVHADVADYLRRGRAGQPVYFSTQTGNFDLYLPFIEKGIALLNQTGRMGYIAPSVWLVNEYGEALRRRMVASRNLDRWIDFKSFQIFEEATTYTALQFFTRSANENVRFVDAPDGGLANIDWTDARRSVPYAELADTENWSLLPSEERAFIARMNATHLRLDDRRICRAIFQGLITSADSVFHLTKLGPGVYQHEPNPASRRAGQGRYEVHLEDAIMKPLVSGAEAKRYIAPETDTCILFPYTEDEVVRLLERRELRAQFPRALAYLRSFEPELRARENGSFDDEAWYRFGRHQNIDKQRLPKVIIPRLVMHLGASWDSEGRSCLDNVDVGGALPATGVDGAYVNAILNGPVADFVFRKKSKPFRGDYRSANRQFIAHLPIPRPDVPQAAAISAAARRLQELHSRRRDLLRDADHRMTALAVERRPPEWLFPVLDAEGRTARIEEIARATPVGARFEASLLRGELRLTANGRTIIDGVFVSEREAPLALAHWRRAVRAVPNSDQRALDSLFAALRNIPQATNPAAATQFARAIDELVALEATIVSAEVETNAHIYAAYGLAQNEIEMIEADRAPIFAPV